MLIITLPFIMFCLKKLVVERDVIGSSVFLITILQQQYLVATSFKSHEICRISTSFVLLHIAFILLL